MVKLKRPAYLSRMRRQLIKHDGSVRCGKHVVCVTRKNLAKLLHILDSVDNADGLKSKKKRTARRLCKLLQAEVPK